MEIEKYLPIGTVLMLKEAKKRIMIIGYLPVSNKDGEKVIYDYAACLYPEGMISSDKTLLFNHDQIEKIYFIGNNDAETTQFLESIKNVEKDKALEMVKETKKEEKKKNEKEEPDLIIED
jgi:hypothetical protein